MNDIEKSENVVSKIVTTLVAAGLRGATISIDDVGSKLNGDHEFFESIVKWLNDEGIIRYQDIIPDSLDLEKVYFEKTVLTAYGFAILNQRSPLKESNESLGVATEKVSKGKANYAGIGELVGGLLGGFTKSIGQ